MATFIPEDKITAIKNSADIVEIISESVVLKKAGKNHLGLCPFHAEKIPSFTVNSEKQIFYCFGCGEGGNIFSFLMKKEGLSFPEAAERLARRCGIEIPTKRMSPEQKKRMNERENLFAINRQAMDFFQRSLFDSAAGKNAMEYLNNRGIKKETINSFCLGYAPAEWDKLVIFFSEKSISPALAEKSGLIVPRKGKSGYYDRFRDRIIFPIFDESRQVIGFGGRVLDDSMPKYLNSPETPLYNKSRSLYGLHSAKEKCRESHSVFIVEGYFDLLALHQHGIQNSVATLGTSLTHEHVRMLRGFIGKTGQVVLVYDSDAAGIKAAQRSIEVFDKGFVDAHILVLPTGYDPDSYLFEFGFESFMNAASGAQRVIPFLIDSATKKHGLSIEGKIRIISDLKEPLAAINDPTKRSLYIKELAERIGIDERAVLDTVREKTKGKAIERIYVQESGSRFERQIIARMLQFPEILPEIRTRNVLGLFENETLKSIGDIILKNSSCSDGRMSEIVNLIDDKTKMNIATSLAIEEVGWDLEDCIKLLTQFVANRSRRENSLLQKIQAAEESNNYELLLQLLKEKQVQAKIRE